MRSVAAVHGDGRHSVPYVPAAHGRARILRLLHALEGSHRPVRRLWCGRGCIVSALRATWRSVRLSIVRETADVPFAQPNAIRHGSDCVALLRAFLRGDPRERCMAIYLDARHRPLAIHTVGIGTEQSCTMGAREVFGPALQLSATSVVVAHNHPSGDPTPSAEDRLVTERLRQAGELLGVELLDHVVLGETRYYTFAEEATFPIGGAS